MMDTTSLGSAHFNGRWRDKLHWLQTTKFRNHHEVEVVQEIEKGMEMQTAEPMRLEVIPVYVVTVGVASRALNIYPMTLQDCCFFEKSKWIPELSAAGLPIWMKMKNGNPH
ncbi:UNVERIFIED_CONTAM: hypothetical protein K2H54_034979 [Gekko kuhli]